MKDNSVDKPNRRHREYRKRHNQILDAAISLFNDKGYVATTTAKIARTAKVTERTLYAHFKNKQELFMECVYSIIGNLLLTWQREIAKNKDDDLGYIRAVAGSFVDFVVHNPDKSMFLVHVFSYRVSPEFDGMVKDFMAGMIQNAQQAIDEMKENGVSKSTLDSRLLAGMFISQYFSMVFINEFVGKEHLAHDNIIHMAKGLLSID